MFKDRYKKAMDNITPSDNAIEKTKNAMAQEKTKKPNIKNTVRIVLIACLIITLVCTSIFAGLKISKTSENIKYDASNVSEENSTPWSDIENYNDIQLKGLKTAESYEEIFAILESIKEEDRFFWTDDLEFEIQEEEVLDGSPSTGNNIGSVTPEHSDTNNQVPGVQEPDIVKNDGKFIYYCREYQNTVNIAKSENGKLENVSTITIQNDFHAQEILLLGNIMAVIGRESVLENDYFEEKTVTVYYDISEKASPKQISIQSQDGYYISARAVDEIVYVITTATPYILYNVEYDNIDLIPEVSNEKIAADDIYIPDNVRSAAFTVVTAFDSKNITNKFKSSIAFLGGSAIVYSSKENIYITQRNPQVYNSDLNSDASVVSNTSNKTNIYRISLNNGNLVTAASGTIEGTVNNQFWMDEQNGILRVASNIQNYQYSNDGYVSSVRFSEEYNKVFCLDGDLKTIGESEKLGIEEQIKSVRYIGDVAYVVTFRLTDPLYAINLSDPTSPKTLSELKIDGFSTYMHPYGSEYLLGIGFEADPETGIQKGLKLTMFDISDSTSVNDISTYSYKWTENAYSQSEALYNHKAVLADANKGIIAIPITREGVRENEYGGYDWTIKSEFVFFEFDGEKLIEKGRVTISDDEKQYVDSYRGLYIGDFGYVVSDQGIISFSLSEFQIIDKLTF